MSDDDKKDDEQEDADKKLDQLVALTGSVIVEPEVVIGDDEATHVREEIRMVSQRVEDGYLDLGSLFYRARKHLMFTRWTSPTTGQPYASWEEYVDHESGFSVRSINYMVAIWWWFSALKSFPIIKDLIREIGWKKARALVGIADDANYEQWFERARQRPFERLDHEARIALRKAGIAKRPTAGLPASLRPDPKGVQPLTEEEEEQEIAGKAKIHGVKKAHVTPLSAIGEAVVEQPDSAGAGERADEDRSGQAPPTPKDVEEYEASRTPWMVKMTKEQKDFVENACKLAWDVLADTDKKAKRMTRAEVSNGYALEMIATHFMTFYSGAAATTKEERHRKFLGDLMKGIERNFDVELVAVDSRAKGDGAAIHGTHDSFFKQVEKKLGVKLVAIREGTTDCIYGFDTAQKMEGLTGPDEDEGDSDERQ